MTTDPYKKKFYNKPTVLSFLVQIWRGYLFIFITRQTNRAVICNIMTTYKLLQVLGMEHYFVYKETISINVLVW